MVKTEEYLVKWLKSGKAVFNFFILTFDYYSIIRELLEELREYYDSGDFCPEIGDGSHEFGLR